MGIIKRYKIANENTSNAFNATYPGYKLYHAREDTYSGTEFFLLTREIMPNGYIFSADETDEMLDARPDVGKVYNGRKLCVYRPDRSLEKFFKVKGEALTKDRFDGFSLTDGVDPGKHRVIIAARPSLPTSSYREEGALSHIFSTVNYQPGEQIPGNELKRLTTPFSRRGLDFYLHDEKAYRARVWAAVKAFC